MYFKNEDLVGWGICIGFSKEFGVHCSHVGCLSHATTERIVNGWTEITPDNEEEVYNLPPERIVVANVVNVLMFYTPLPEMSITISTMAKYGGYYYYELPELKL